MNRGVPSYDVKPRDQPSGVMSACAIHVRSRFMSPVYILCKGGKVRGSRLRIAVATELVDPAPTPPGPPFARGGKCAGFVCAVRWRRSWVIRPPPPLAPPLQGGESARVSLARCGGDGAGRSGLHPPGPPFARGESAGLACALRWRRSWLIRPPPPWPPPFARGGKCAGFACAVRWRRSWLIRPPPPWPPPCKGKVRVSLARCGGDVAGWSGPHPPWPPLCKGGKVRGFRLRIALATELVDPAPTPLAPPLQGGGKCALIPSIHQLSLAQGCEGIREPLPDGPRVSLVSRLRRPAAALTVLSSEIIYFMTLAYSYVFPCYFVRRSQGDSGGGSWMTVSWRCLVRTSINRTVV